MVRLCNHKIPNKMDTVESNSEEKIWGWNHCSVVFCGREKRQWIRNDGRFLEAGKGKGRGSLK